MRQHFVMRQLLDESGFIREPCSDRWGLPPKDDPARMQLLLRRRWLWLLIPVAGIIPMTMDCDELTHDYGFTPWWL